MSSIFTVHIDVFFNLPLFREAMKAIQDQTYQNLEIIILIPRHHQTKQYYLLQFIPQQLDLEVLSVL